MAVCFLLLPCLARTAPSGSYEPPRGWLLLLVVPFHQVPIPVSQVSPALVLWLPSSPIYGAEILQGPAGSGPVSFPGHLHSCFFFSGAEAAPWPSGQRLSLLSLYLSGVLLCLHRQLSYLSAFSSWSVCSSALTILSPRSHPNSQAICSTQIVPASALVSLCSGKMWTRCFLAISTQLSHDFLSSVCFKLMKSSSIHT